MYLEASAETHFDYSEIAIEPPPASVTRLVARRGRGSLDRADDAELAAAASAGDALARRAIYKRYSPLVRSKLRRCLGTVDLDDHVQEVMMRLFWSLPQLRESAALRSYIIGITLRIAGSVRRSHRRHWWLRLTPTGDLPERRACSSDDPEAREALWHFHAILEKLGPRTRRAFELRHVAKLELTDVASALGISLATTKRLLARASNRVFAMVRRDALLVEYYGLV